jgi:energy-coupling factor transporter ATP-binding protein EcfA2
MRRILPGTLTESSKLWLRSLTIHRYEQFRDCPRVELSPDDNLVLGINGSGKTSLLRLLAAVLRWNYDALLGQPFDIEFEQVLELAPDKSVSIQGRVRYQPAPPAMMQQSQARRVARSKYDGLEATFSIRHDRWTCTAHVRDSLLDVVDGASVLGHLPLQTAWMAWEIANVLMDGSEDVLAEDHPASIVERIHERAMATFMVRETDIDFAKLTKSIPYRYASSFIEDPGDVSEDENPQWFPLLYEVVTEAAGQKNDHGYFAPVTYERDAEVGRGLDMRPLLKALDAKSISFRPEIEKTESLAEGERLEGKGVDIRVLFPSGTEVRDSLLTFGQKRLITIALGALICGGSPLLVDEIDNGLHPGLLEKTLEIIRGRQTFLASHNKLVVDLLDYDSPEDLRRTIHLCRREPDGTQRLVALSDDQVREVFEKIEVGIMNPSDVLLGEGLW